MLYKVSVTGLSPRTQYVLYVVAEDDEATPNVQSAPAVKPFTTGSSGASLQALVARVDARAPFEEVGLKTSVSTYHTVVGFRVIRDYHRHRQRYAIRGFDFCQRDATRVRDAVIRDGGARR